MVMIFLLSHQDKDASRESSGFFVNILQWLGFSYEWLLANDIPGLIRKLAHLTIYAILLVLTVRVERALSPSQDFPWKSFIWCLLFAISDEVHQMFVPGRGPHVLDVLLDMVGAFLGWVCMRFYLKTYIYRNVDNV